MPTSPASRPRRGWRPTRPPSPDCRRRRRQEGTWSGPLVTLHTNGDQLATVEHEQAYAATVGEGGSSRSLRQLFTERAGHCTFTPAEIITAMDVLLRRIDTDGSTRTSAVERSIAGRERSART